MGGLFTLRQWLFRSPLSTQPTSLAQFRWRDDETTRPRNPGQRVSSFAEHSGHGLLRRTTCQEPRSPLLLATAEALLLGSLLVFVAAFPTPTLRDFFGIDVLLQDCDTINGTFSLFLAGVAVGTSVDLTPPARIRTCRIAACGSYRGCLASKRKLG